MPPEKQINLNSEEGKRISGYLSSIKPFHTNPSLTVSDRSYVIGGHPLRTIVELRSPTMKVICDGHLAKKLTAENVLDFSKSKPRG